MSFLWPSMLVGLLVVPALAWAYVRWYRRARDAQARLAAIGMRSVGPATRLGWRRHLPAGVLLASVAVLVVALARPEVTLAMPRRTGTVIVVVDVSNSMAADDVVPDRLEAARSGALELVEALPPAVAVGVVAFGDGAQILAQPTDDRDVVVEAVERLAVSGATSTGAGLYAALEAVVGEPLVSDDDEAGEDGEDGAGGVAAIDPSEIEIGYFGSSSVVVFSDGENTSGIDPLVVADVLARAGVKVTTVAVGTAAGDVIEVDGYSVSTALDGEQLEAIAAATNGRYYEAADATVFAAIADDLELEWRTEGELTEITGLLAAIAAGMLIVSAGLAAWLVGRVI